MTPQEFALPDNSIETNMAKLSVFISRFQARFCQGQRSVNGKESFFHTLEAWASGLPQNLRYFAEIDGSQSSQVIEAGSVSEISVMGLK